jgi:hypothetical protein
MGDDLELGGGEGGEVNGEGLVDTPLGQEVQGTVARNALTLTQPPSSGLGAAVRNGLSATGWAQSGMRQTR